MSTLVVPVSLFNYQWTTIDSFINDLMFWRVQEFLVAFLEHGILLDSNQVLIVL